MRNPNTCTFYIVRHGQTEWNVKRVIQGHLDAPLVEMGIDSSKQLAEKLKSIKFDAIFSSDLIRAKQTADILALERNLAVKTVEILRERNFGKYEGKSISIFTDELKQLVEEFEKMSDEHKKKYRYPTMESDEEIVGRFITFLREVAVSYPGKIVLVVSHSVMISVLLIHLGYMSYADNPTYSFKHGSYAIIESDGIEFEVKGIHKSHD